MAMDRRERETFERLLGMVKNMVVPEHDLFAGHNRHTCRICRTVETGDAILAGR